MVLVITEPIKSQSKTVCVIGAGPSGLVSARELKKEGHKVVVMEQNHDVGGQWLYQPNVEEEDTLGKTKILKVHSSVYSSLRLASPRETMGFSDFPFTAKEGRDSRRFPGHEELWLYLKDFCQVFGLRDMIRFNVRVEFVGMVNEDDDVKRWMVKSVEKESGEVMEEVFDAVVVASGHYSYPRLPSIKGMNLWKRKQLHSHIYRVPDPFRDEVVVVVGSSMSGQDISIELVKVAKEVHLSAKSLEIPPGLTKVIEKHQNLHLHPQIESLEEDGRVIFDDGSCIVADTILYCTGYDYKLPFLESKGRVEIDDNRVGPLFEHTFSPYLSPSLSFVGIPRKLIGFPFFESQAKWIAKLLSGKTSLPSSDQMMQSISEFYLSRVADGIPKRNTHDIADFNYSDKYADYIGFPHLEEWRKVLCVSAIVNSIQNLETYRDSWDDDDLLQETLQNPYFTQEIPSV
ncbi:FAD/NAD(P)-binding domain superfamily [Arabidopsis thaliana x Arabidopsis arenosa]|uniref:Flavin-containing monooxygenase n=1 Tax=Arabidopsis thaliana x Arabidopsis arenosa TaxID=1240361 RepID=A0A8T1XRX9_9BRAS|nr:FAD/NAD(P)-binding domain superfamily [Arabidopsis thaliana x Arabidopsis arenosa]